MNHKETIGIAHVLARLSDAIGLMDAEVKEFGIRCYTAAGELREFRARKYVREPKRAGSAPAERGKAFHSLQEKGLVMLQDLEQGRIINVRATSIYGFRDHNSKQWLKVFH